MQNNERTLRKTLRQVIIKKVSQRNTLNETKHFEYMSEKNFRNIIRTVLSDIIYGPIVENINDNPHNSTGANMVALILKQIIPEFGEGYKSLMSSEQQRHSYKAHIMNGIRAIFDRLDDEKNIDKIPLQEQNELDLGLPSDTFNDTEFIDVEQGEKKSTVPDEDYDGERTDFHVDGADATGRNVAFTVFKRKQKQIEDIYNILEDDEDRTMFRKLLTVNLDKYFDRWEQEIATKG